MAVAPTIRVNFHATQRTEVNDPAFRSDFITVEHVEVQSVKPNVRFNYFSAQRVEYQHVLPQMRMQFFLAQYVQRAPEIDMVTEVYPELRGLTYNTISKPTFSTDIADHTSGKETATQYWDGPKWDFQLQYDYLPNKSPAFNTDFKTLVGFFLARGGRFETFLFKAPDDRYVENFQLGIGDAVQTEWLLYRPMGSFLEPVGQADPDNTTVWVEVVAEPLVVPATPGPYTATLVHTNIDRLNFVKEGATLYTQVPGAPGNHQYNFDPDTATFTFAAANQGANLIVSYKYVAVAAVDYTINMPRTIAFTAAPPITATITASYQFFFVVRFLDDVAEFDQFMDKLWELGQINFRSILE